MIAKWHLCSSAARRFYLRHSRWLALMSSSILLLTRPCAIVGNMSEVRVPSCSLSRAAITLVLMALCHLMSLDFATAAQLLAVPSGNGCSSAAVAIWSGSDSVVWLQHDDTIRHVSLPDGMKAEALMWSSSAGVVLFGAGQMLVLGRSADEAQSTVLGAGPQQVRSAVEVGPNLAVLVTGGRYQEGRVVDAEASLWELRPRPRRLWDGPGKQVNPICLTAGTLAGSPCVLMGVDKTAILDPTLRLRPWLYRLQGNTLQPMWFGTSFSQPFITALLADICPHYPDDEVCSLELTARGERQVTVYRWHGFVMEGIAQSRAADFGDQLRRVRNQPHSDIVFAWQGGADGRIVGLAVEHWPQHQLAELQVCCATSIIPRPLAWDVRAGDNSVEACILDASGTMSLLRLENNVIR